MFSLFLKLNSSFFMLLLFVYSFIIVFSVDLNVVDVFYVRYNVGW
jgi:hypothetical protein